MLQRIRTLAVQAANGTNTRKDREALQQEVDSLCYEVSRIAYKTTFAGAHVLMSKGAKATANGRPGAGGAAAPDLDTLKNANGEYFFQVGANANDTINLKISSGFHMWGILSMAGFKDADIQKTGKLSQAATTNKLGLYMSDANKFSALRWSVITPSCAQATLAGIDRFIEAVDSQRAELGAIQNRMESTIRNQSSIAENESDARSRIRDTDFASETAALTQNQIIQQASQTILSQANQRPTVALNLLGG